MKEFVKSLLTNRLGIVFGIINVCCIPLNVFINNHFSLPFKTKLFLEHAFTCVNLPAMIISTVFGAITGEIFPVLSFNSAVMIFLPIFILIQWVFIGRLSKYIAKEIAGK